MTDNTNLEAGVHRLVDMVVEEVSLVDRAANKHRFLIVKRSDAMNDDDAPTEVPTTKVGPEDAGASTEALDDDSPLGAAVAALTGLTDLVERLATATGEDAPHLSALAQQLSALAAALLEGLDIASEEDGETEAVEARAAPLEAESPSEAMQASLAAMKAATQRLAGRCAKPPAASKPAAKGEAAQLAEATGKALTALSDSLQHLSQLTKAQQQRLVRLESQAGLPNSVAPAEQLSKAAPEELGWPLDLNRPMDRASVDKALSFHDA